jgi:hypothetical protein
MVTMDKKIFAIDGSLNPDEQVEGYTTGKTWNGWACVFLDKENLLKWLNNSPYDHKENPDGSITIYFEEEETFIPCPDGLYDMSGYCFSEVES